MSTNEWAMISELTVDPEGVDALEAAFADRLHEVDGTPGFVRLEVLRDCRCNGSYLMVSWWTSREEFTTWFRSDGHRQSHDRVPALGSPRPVSFRRYEVISR